MIKMAVPESLQPLKDELKEIYEYRTIFKSLVWKNLFGRYRNSYLGFIWHFFTPVLMMLVYYIGFTEIRSNNMDSFWVFLASGLFPFTFMMSNIVSGSTYVTGSAGMLQKMYFPREIVVLSHVTSSFIVMLIGYSIVLLITVISGFALNWVCIMVVPVVMILMFMFALGCAFLVSSLTVYLRDLQYLLSSVSMAFFFLTPMYFVASETTGILHTVVWLNPLTYYVESFHQLVYWGIMPEWWVLGVAFALGIVLLIVGWFVFNRLKHGFVERL